MATALAEPEMAKKKPQHKREEPTGTSFQLKVPVEYWGPLHEIEKTVGRPMTISAQMALEIYFRMMGVEFTANWPEVLAKPPGKNGGHR